MKKYVASTPKAKVIGAALQAYHDSTEYKTFEDVLKTYGLDVIEPEMWYPQQLTLDVQRAIKNGANGGMALVSIGVKIIDNAIFPPMNSLEEALQAFAASYPMNFRDQAPQDLIYAKLIEPGKIHVINASPHADEMIYGYIYALIRRFAPTGKYPIVEFEDASKIDSDEDTVFVVTW